MWKILSRWFNITCWLKVQTLIPLIILSIILAGCGPQISTDFNTKALELIAEVTATGDGQTIVSVRILQGKGLLMEVLLATGDELKITAYETTKTITNTGSSANPKYQATFDSDASGAFIIAFNRPPAEVSAPNTTVLLPQGFEVTSTMGSQEFSPGDALRLDWTQDGLLTEISIQGNCQIMNNSTPEVTRQIDFHTSSNTGSITIPVSQLLGDTTLATGETCSAAVSLSRTNNGNVDPNLKEYSSIVATQVRKVGDITIIP